MSEITAGTHAPYTVLVQTGLHHYICVLGTLLVCFSSDRGFASFVIGLHLFFPSTFLHSFSRCRGVCFQIALLRLAVANGPWGDYRRVRGPAKACAGR